MNLNFMGGVVEFYGQKWLFGVFKYFVENFFKYLGLLLLSMFFSWLNFFMGEYVFFVYEMIVVDNVLNKLYDVIVEQNKNWFIIERIVIMVLY